MRARLPNSAADDDQRVGGADLHPVDRRRDRPAPAAKATIAATPRGFSPANASAPQPPAECPKTIVADRPDEGLRAQVGERRHYLAGGSVAGPGIVGIVAATLILKIVTAGRAMAGTFRHQHRKAARHQPG